ncbi:MAG: sulfite exporter TauE/SafE family protein [Rhodobacteraceae bacterium]|nr:sulfite exporter TauE/SafE family protein [Paracoccaceae bacterium]
MITDPSLYIPLLLLGAFAAAFVTGAVGFADALILNAIWLHIMPPAAAIPLVVSCGIAMHALPLFKLRKQLDFSRLPPFLLAGILGVPAGAWMLTRLDPQTFRTFIGGMLAVYGIWMLLKPKTSVGEAGGRKLDGVVGLAGGFMGGFAGLSGLFPTLWAGLRGWPKDKQRGVYQPFVLAMHALGILVFAASGLITARTGVDLLWCLPAILIGSWLGVMVYPYLNEAVFRRIIQGLVLISGISLLL